jgi:hypothetical protein
MNFLFAKSDDGRSWESKPDDFIDFEKDLAVSIMFYLCSNSFGGS